MKKFLGQAVSCFLHGFLSLLPLLISALLVWKLLRWLDALVDDTLLILPPEHRASIAVAVTVKVLALVLLFTAIALFGLLVRTLIGKTIVDLMDRVGTSLPGVRTIYSATKQLSGLFSGGGSKLFTKPVLVEFPSPGMWMIGFLTGEADEAMAAGQGMVTVFIPTTPNPTSGFFVVLARDRLRETNLTVEEAITLLLTGGVAKKASPDLRA